MNIKTTYYIFIGFFTLLFIGLPSYGLYFYQTHTYDDAALAMAPFDYPQFQPHCAPQTKKATSGATTNQRTPKGYRFTVKTPQNYNPTYPHPLLVVYAPSISGSLMEKFVGLTHQATAAGFLIAYVDGKSLSLNSIIELGHVPLEIAQSWCVNEQRIYFTGHSDGGTASSALAFLEESPVTPRAIAPSAAGINGEEFAQMECPTPTSVMVMHNKDDGHFPGFGKQAAQWWAQCNQCDATLIESDTTACKAYTNCPAGIETLYCEGEGNHLRWPRFNEQIIAFFKRNAQKN